MAVTIMDVEPGSPAQKAGLRGGMRLVQAGGHPINDGLDYEFYTAAARLELLVQSDGAPRTVVVHKQEYQPLGCLFQSYLIDKQHACRNRCVFCFIDQMPKGLRPSLYFKDDDERLGFLFGNYVTLTNLGDAEIQRIIDMRISPVNISVHTVNPALRCQMMGNKDAGRVLEYIPRLAAAGIEMNFQLVLVPGLNDGDELRRSVQWLAGFAPATVSIAAVPVGLTRHRQGLAPLVAYTRESARQQLDIMLELGDAQAQAGDGLRLLYPSDEWFLLAGRPLPQADFYDGFPQLENGVGMWRMLYDDFCDALDALEPAAGLAPPPADLATGALAAPLLAELAELLRQKRPKAEVAVHTVYNDFFGRSITVAGLLTGQDIMAQLQGRLHSRRLLLPAETLRAEGDVLLDDTTPAKIEKALGTVVQMVPNSGQALLHAMLGLEQPE